MIQSDPVLLLVEVKTKLEISLSILRDELLVILTPLIGPTLEVLSLTTRLLWSAIFLCTLLAVTVVRNLVLVFLLLLQAALAEVA